MNKFRTKRVVIKREEKRCQTEMLWTTIKKELNSSYCDKELDFTLHWCYDYSSLWRLQSGRGYRCASEILAYGTAVIVE